MYFFSSAGLIACKDVGIFEAFSCPWPPSPTFYKLLEIERCSLPVSRQIWAECHTALWDEYGVECTTRIRVSLTRPVVTARYAGNTSLVSTTSLTPCRGPGGSYHRSGGNSTWTMRCGILGP